MKNLTFNNPSTAIDLTVEQAVELGIDINKDTICGETKTIGPWNIVKSYKALTVSAIFSENKVIQKTIYGIRTLTNIRQGGYELNGYVSINGKKYSAFSSSQLFRVEGNLIDVATIHARVRN